MQSLTRLAAIKPDLWLPASPVDGQNANLYDGDWRREIEENLRLIHSMISRMRRDDILPRRVREADTSPDAPASGFRPGPSIHSLAPSGL